MARCPGREGGVRGGRKRGGFVRRVGGGGTGRALPLSAEGARPPSTPTDARPPGPPNAPTLAPQPRKKKKNALVVGLVHGGRGLRCPMRRGKKKGRAQLCVCLCSRARHTWGACEAGDGCACGRGARDLCGCGENRLAPNERSERKGASERKTRTPHQSAVSPPFASLSPFSGCPPRPRDLLIVHHGAARRHCRYVLLLPAESQESESPPGPRRRVRNAPPSAASSHSPPQRLHPPPPPFSQAPPPAPPAPAPSHSTVGGGGQRDGGGVGAVCGQQRASVRKKHKQFFLPLFLSPFRFPRPPCFRFRPL